MALRPYSPIRARAETSINSAGTSPTVNYPSAVTAGDLLLFVCVSDTVQTITASGWTQLGSTETAQTDSSAVFYKTAAGTEGGGTFTVSTSTTNRDFKAVCWAIDGGGTPEGNVNTGLSATPTPSSLTHSGGAGDYLNILAVMLDLDRTITEWPDGLGDWLVPGTNIGSVQLSTASGLSASATYNPGALAAEASDGWHAWNIAVPISGLDSTGWPVMEGAAAVSHWTTAATTQTMNLPSGITAGELLLAEIMTSRSSARPNDVGIPSISGWTQVFTDLNIDHARGTVLYKVATGSEGATVSVSMTLSDLGSAVVRRFSGADDTQIEYASNNASSATAVIPSLTHSAGSAKILWLTGLAMDGDTGLPENWQANGRYGLGGVWGRTTVSDLEQGSVYSSFEGIVSASLSTFSVKLEQSRRHVAYTIALYPAATGVTGILDATMADITADLETELGTPIGDGDTNTDVGAGFGTGPFGEPIYVDIAEYIRAMDFGRGRSSVFQTFDAGTASLVLDNRDGRFDPGNTAGPYYPNVAVGAPIRIRLQRDNTSSVMWAGNIDRVRLEYPGGGHDAIAVVEASENIGLLVRRVLENNYAAANSADRVDDVLDEAGWPTTLRTLSTSALTDVPAIDYSEEATSRPSAWQHIVDTATAEQGAAYVDKDGKLVFEGRVDAPNTSSATFGVGVGEYPYQSLTLAYDNDLLINRATALGLVGDWQTADDTTSQGIHGIREQAYELDTLTGEPAALNVAQWTVLRYATVVQRVESININPDADPDNLWPFVRDVELRDLITVKFATPGAGDDINQVCRVEWLRHTAVPGQGGWNLALGLLPVPAIELEDFFTLDVSELDSTDVLA